MQKLLHTAFLILAFSAAGHAQTTPVTALVPIVPTTKLEELQATSGVALVQSFSRIGEMSGSVSRGGGSVSLEALEVFNSSSGRHEYGLAVEVTESGHPDRTNRSLIDYDEIAGLLAGIDYISKVDPKVVKFESYKADYLTKNYLQVSVFTNVSGREPSISIVSGQINPTTVYFNLNDLAKFRDYIVAGKTRIEGAIK